MAHIFFMYYEWGIVGLEVFKWLKINGNMMKSMRAGVSELRGYAERPGL